MKKLENKSGLMISGGILAAITASMCCIGPLVLTMLGVSGAAVLAKFDFLRLPMIGVGASLFAVAGFSLYRKKETCEPGSICADPKKYRRMVVAFWFGLTAAGLVITAPVWVGWLFG